MMPGFLYDNINLNYSSQWNRWLPTKVIFNTKSNWFLGTSKFLTNNGWSRSLCDQLENHGTLDNMALKLMMWIHELNNVGAGLKSSMYTPQSNYELLFQTSWCIQCMESMHCWWTPTKSFKHQSFKVKSLLMLCSHDDHDWSQERHLPSQDHHDHD